MRWSSVRQTPDARLESPVNTFFSNHGPDQPVKHFTDIFAANVEPFPFGRP